MREQMTKQHNRLGVNLLGIVSGMAEGPWGIMGFVVLVMMVLWWT
jgi:hypothetical protein